MTKSFETEKGSVYTYVGDGRTARSKTATGEQFEEQDVTVFTNLSPDQEQVVLHAIHQPREGDDGKKKVYVIERGPKDEVFLVRRPEQIKNRDRLFLAVYQNGQGIGVFPASLEPRLGAQVFDTRHFTDSDGHTMTERHLGNRVIKIVE